MSMLFQKTSRNIMAQQHHSWNSHFSPGLGGVWDIFFFERYPSLMQVPKLSNFKAALWTYGFQFFEGAPTLCCEIVSSLIKPLYNY